MAKDLEETGKPFRPAEPAKRSAHIGPGPRPGPKRAVNVSVDAEILKVAKEMKINLSQVLEDGLRTLTKDERTKRWQAEHREALDSYNALIERAGVAGEELLDLDDPPV